MKQFAVLLFWAVLANGQSLFNDSAGRFRSGLGAPPAGDCATVEHTDRVYTDRSAIPTVVYVCRQTGAGVFAWTNIGLASGGSGDMLKSENLSGLPSYPTARTNLGLGDSATKNTGTTAGTVAAGDDSRITGAVQKSSNLGDLTSIPTARSNLGMAPVATSGSAADLSTGTLPSARLPNPAVGSKGGVEAKACPGTDKMNGIGTDGLPTCGTDQNTGGGGGGSTAIPVSVKDSPYNATGNGSTDDYAAIAAAIAAAGTGGTVFFPCGNYRVNTTVALLAGQTALAPQGSPFIGTCAKLIKGANIDTITLNNVSNVTIKGLAFDGGYNHSTDTGFLGNSIFLTGNASNIRIDGIRCENTEDGCVVGTNTSNVIVENSYFASTGGDGTAGTPVVFFNQNASNVKIRNNWGYPRNGGSHFIAIHTEVVGKAINNVEITGNFCFNNGGGYCAEVGSFTFGGDDSERPANILISGNYGENNANSSGGISLDWAKDAVVSNNIWKHNSGTATAAIENVNGQNVVITGNKVDGGGLLSTGIASDHEGQGLRISNNIVNNLLTTSSGEYIVLRAGSAYCFDGSGAASGCVYRNVDIHDNTILMPNGAQSQGIRFVMEGGAASDSADGVRIYDNTIRVYGAGGLRTNGTGGGNSAAIIFQSNNTTGTTWAGRNTINNNAIHGTAYAMWLQNIGKVDRYNNKIENSANGINLTGTNLTDSRDGDVLEQLQSPGSTLAKATCAAGTRRRQFFTEGGSGVADTWEVCTKDAGGSYAWRTVYPQSGGVSIDYCVPTSAGNTITIATPCRARIGGQVVTQASNATVVVSSTQGTARIYISDGSDGAAVGTLKVRYSAASGLTCTNCTAEYSQTTYPGNSFQIATVVSPLSATWDPPQDLRAFANVEKVLTVGAGSLLTETATQRTVATDQTAVSFKYSGAGAPSGVSGSTRGDIYLNTTDGSLYVCNNGSGCGSSGFVAVGGSSYTAPKPWTSQPAVNQFMPLNNLNSSPWGIQRWLSKNSGHGSGSETTANESLTPTSTRKPWGLTLGSAANSAAWNLTRSMDSGHGFCGMLNTVQSGKYKRIWFWVKSEADVSNTVPNRMGGGCWTSGETDPFGTSPGNMVRFYYNSAANANWRFQIKVGGTLTDIDTGLAVANSTEYVCAAEWNGTTWTWYVESYNGSTGATISSVTGSTATTGPSDTVWGAVGVQGLSKTIVIREFGYEPNGN